jgi:hypothetical protein
MILPDVVTFWHGPLDRLRQTCLRSQVAAGHKVTVYSFDAIPGLPEGVGGAEAEAVLPYSFSEKLRPAQPDGSWRDWTTLQFSDFFRMRLMAQGAGLWLDADVLLLKPIQIDPAKPLFAWERPRQIGNSVLYLPPDDPIVRAFEGLMEQEELTPDWLSLRHRLTFYAAAHARRLQPPFRHPRGDLWPGRADRARQSRRLGAQCAAEEIVLCGACRAEAFLRAGGCFQISRRPRDHRPTRLAERTRQLRANPGKPLRLGRGAVHLAIDAFPELGRYESDEG